MVSAHPHGPHDCYCPNCGQVVSAGADIKCNTIPCPECQTQMRAVETGERRAVGGNISQEEEVNLLRELGLAILTGFGLGVGFYIFKKVLKS